MHGEVGRYAAEKGVDTLLAVGPLCINAVREFGANGQHFEGKELLVEYLAESGLESLLEKNVVVLVKGSRFMAMEQIARLIKESGEQ